MKKIKNYVSILMVAAMYMYAVTSCDPEEDEILNPDAKIESFSFPKIVGNAAISHDAGTITAKLEADGDLTKIVPEFRQSKGAKVRANGKDQESGVTEVNFSSSVRYTVYSEDGKNENDYVVTITKEGSGGGDPPLPPGTVLTNTNVNGADVQLAKGTYTCDVALTLSANTKLTLAPGVIIQFGANGSLTVSGANAQLIANGTAADSIVFTSSVAAKAIGQWGYIRVNQPASSFKYCVFEAGASGSSSQLHVENCKVIVENCAFRLSRGTGIYLNGANSGFESFTNNKMSKCGETETGRYPMQANTTIASLDGYGAGNVITTGKGVAVAGGSLNATFTTLKSLGGVPYIFLDTPTITNGNTLTIEAGAILKFVTGKAFNVNSGARLVAKGNVTDSIKFTSEVVVTGQQAGQWVGIYLADGALACEFEYCTFEYGSSGSSWTNEGMIHLHGSKASFSHCLFRKAKNSGIYIQGAGGFTKFEYNTIKQCEDETNAYPIKVGDEANLGGLDGYGEGNEIITAKGVALTNGGNITAPTTLKSLGDVAYLFLTQPTVKAGNKLTIEEGTIIKFAKDVGMNVEATATIEAKGKADKKIVFTSATAITTPGSNNWSRINFAGDGSVFEHCLFENGSSLSSWAQTGMIRLDNCKASFSNCEFKNSLNSGIHLYHAGSGFTLFENNTMSGCGEGANLTSAYPIKTEDGGIFPLAGIGTGNTITTNKGIGMHGGTSDDMTIRAGFPYTVYGDASINAGATVTILAGAELRFELDKTLTLNGNSKIIADGTAGEIKFTSAQSTKEPGNWRGLLFNASNSSDFKNCVFEYGSGGSNWTNEGVIHLTNSKVSFTNCKFRNNKYSSIYLYQASSGFLTFNGNTVEASSHAQGYPIWCAEDGYVMAIAGMSANNTIDAKGIAISGTVNDDLTLHKYNYVVTKGDLNITGPAGGNATLTIAAGATLKFDKGSGIYVNARGRLKAEGTSATNRVTFTAIAQELGGYWEGIHFTNNDALAGNILDWCDISWGGSGTSWTSNGNITYNMNKGGYLSISNCLISNSRSWGIYTNSAAYQPTIDTATITYTNNGKPTAYGSNHGTGDSAVIGNY